MEGDPQTRTHGEFTQTRLRRDAPPRTEGGVGVEEEEKVRGKGREREEKHACRLDV